MSARVKIACLILYVISCVTILFGLIDLLTPRILPYHETYLGMPQAQLHPKVVGLLLTSLRIIGVLLVSIGIALAIIVRIPFSRGETWSWWFILVFLGIVLAPLLLITLQIGLYTPWWVIAALLVLLVLALSISRPSQRRRRTI